MLMSKSEDLVFVKGNHWPVLRIFSPIQMIRHCITFYIKLFKYLRGGVKEAYGI